MNHDLVRTVDPPSRTRRRLVAAVLAATLVATLTGLAAGPAQGADPLLSQGRPVTASSTQSAAFPASAAVDGDPGTRWSSAAADPQWLSVDLGAAATVSQVVLTWEAAYATAYQVQASADGATWTTLRAVTGGDGGVDTLTVAGTGRYVRVLTTARGTAYGVSLWEFQVYGTSTATGCDTTGNAALGRPATASSTENAALPASAAVDGNPGTRWSSAAADPQWLRVDLGADRAVCRVDLTWEAAYATAYQIQLSADGAAWTTVYATTTGAGGTQRLTVTGSGRYLRVLGTARATAYGYSLWEVAVRTTGATPTTPTPTTPPPSGGDVLLSYGKPAVASSYQDDGACWQCSPARAFDQDPASRWATSATTGWVDPGWIYVDLGATATVHRVVLQWDAAYATAYQLQTSTDATTWTTIYRTTSNPGFRQDLTVSGTGRYVRMYGTARSNGYGYSLWEFQVYGTGGAPTAPPARPADPTFPATTLVFADEFDGPAGARPDAAKWTVDPGTGQNNESQYYTDNANAAMNGAGQLVMEARRENAGGRAYTSHRMNTGTKFQVQYGRIESRIKVPKGNGLWPAFWMMGGDFLTGRPWPYNGEIDIMEILGRDTYRSYTTLHAPAYNGGGGYGQEHVWPVDLSADFHVYAVEWDSRGMRFLVDGTQVFYASKDTVETTRGPWVFDHPFYLILNLAVGGDWPGPPDASTPFPARMLVDYVRVYR
ncbi:discoidin domain-containing protein [Micromonospora sp. NPDC051300]|uniref:discoidin domain-containing protein n=1 Tax=Micromonospora sp. NPDC051300 TaxID=3364286 RepID=UPI0037B71476